ncbi:serine/threonine protein kinase, variant [Aphanomyces invadans]|uniref:Serine/threonine protein kinase, variant n=1 Tax=Aphanomyces invadans TaxID=157072 RepID=A0A024TTN2_9STRA|nr:serine/threonine protein kinase, variant [Aphanomyces invadans]ETV96966.1 serine/threonine protein kinase, variant [Aphanomyces invadans]|eukprot:XP_008874212.1 serine/threonine protein kinase, variant [Aphanomyces invadans]
MSKEVSLYIAARLGQIQDVKMYLAQGANVNWTNLENNGWTPLHAASERGYVEIVKILVDNGANVNATDTFFGNTSLHEASQHGRVDVVKILLDNGANANAPNLYDGSTPLHSAASSCFEHAADAVEWLLDAGASLSTRNKSGMSARDVAAEKNRRAALAALDRWTKGAALFHAAKSGLVREVLTCLAQGANVNWRNKAEQGWTALQIAWTCGHVDVVQALLDAKADVNTTDEDGHTPVHIASSNGKHAVVKPLVLCGAKNDPPSTLRDLPCHEVPGHVEPALHAKANASARMEDGIYAQVVAEAVMALDQDAQALVARSIDCFCAGQHDLAVQIANEALATLGIAKSAWVWIGENLRGRGQYEQALAAYVMGQQVDPSDVDCIVGMEDVRDTIQVAKVFNHNMLQLLAKDRRMREYLKDKAFVSRLNSIQADPTQYDPQDKRLAHVFEYLHDRGGIPPPHVPPSVAPLTDSFESNGTPIGAIPIKESLTELTEYLLCPGTPTVWRLSNTYLLITDLVNESSHCVFKAEDPTRRHKQFVVKLTDQEAEVTFVKRMNDRDDSKHVANVVECVQVCTIPLAGPAKTCFALVMEQGEPLDTCHLRNLQRRPLLALECVQDVAKALQFLHRDHAIIHGDVKLENVLYFDRAVGYKLIDFDQTVTIGSAMRLHCTHEYCPPEMARLILQRHNHVLMAASPTFDVWCLGVLMLKLFVDGGHLEEFDGVAAGDGILEIVAAPGFCFRKSLAKASHLNSRQMTFLMTCLEPDVSKRANNVNDIVDIATFESPTSTMPPTRSASKESVCEMPSVWTITIVNGRRRLPRGDVLRGLECRIGVVNVAGATSCKFDQDKSMTASCGSDVVALVLPFFRVLMVLLDVLDALEDHGADVASWKALAWPPIDSIHAAVDALESIHTTTTVLPIELELRALDDRLTQMTCLAMEEVEALLASVTRALKQFATSSDTLERVVAVLTCPGVAPTCVGGLVGHVHPATGVVAWKCCVHGGGFVRGGDMASGAVANPGDLPLLWSLEPMAQLGSRIKDPPSLRRDRFRLVFQCEWRRESACHTQQHDARNDAMLQLLGDSDAIRCLLPMLKVSSLVLRALSVAAVFGLTLHGLRFDYTKLPLGLQTIAAMEALHGSTRTLHEWEATFESILDRLDAEDTDDAEMASQMNKLQMALTAYRVAVDPIMKDALAGLGFDWKHERLGGLTRVTLPTGHSRWVCDLHRTMT